jgi:hypothetical protein
MMIVETKFWSRQTYTVFSDDILKSLTLYTTRTQTQSNQSGGGGNTPALRHADKKARRGTGLSKTANAPSCGASQDNKSDGSPTPNSACKAATC